MNIKEKIELIEAIRLEAAYCAMAQDIATERFGRTIVAITDLLLEIVNSGKD